MNTIKNYLIAVLTGLLVLTLSTQNSNGAITTKPVTLSSSDLKTIAEATPYVSIGELTKLAEYSHCLSERPRIYNSISPSRDMSECSTYKP